MALTVRVVSSYAYIVIGTYLHSVRDSLTAILPRKMPDPSIACYAHALSVRALCIKSYIVSALMAYLNLSRNNQFSLGGPAR